MLEHMWRKKSEAEERTNHIIAWIQLISLIFVIGVLLFIYFSQINADADTTKPVIETNYFFNSFSQSHKV